MKRCMIIDDSAVIRKVAKRILGGPDLRIIESDSGGDALAKCRGELPDYIILDCTLPDYTPVEFLTALKGIASQNMPMVLVLVIQIDIVQIMRAKRAGAAGYLLKPFTREQLTSKFRDYAEKAGKQADAA